MAKFHRTKDNHLAFHCLGCDMIHVVDARWTFNDDLEKPTISPSLKVSYLVDEEDCVCHSFIREGAIQYLSDCTHHLAGKTIEIPDFETTHPDWIKL